jgi:hypothetical protein
LRHQQVSARLGKQGAEVYLLLLVGCGATVQLRASLILHQKYLVPSNFIYSPRPDLDLLLRALVQFIDLQDLFGAGLYLSAEVPQFALNSLLTHSQMRSPFSGLFYFLPQC